MVPEDPVNDQILESEEDREQREYEEEAQAYFDALDYALDKYETREPDIELPVAKIHKTGFFTWLIRMFW